MKPIVLCLILFIAILTVSKSNLEGYSINTFIFKLKSEKLFDIILSIKKFYGQDVAIISCEELKKGNCGNCKKLVTEYIDNFETENENEIGRENGKENENIYEFEEEIEIRVEKQFETKIENDFGKENKNKNEIGNEYKKESIEEILNKDIPREISKLISEKIIQRVRSRPFKTSIH